MPGRTTPKNRPQTRRPAAPQPSGGQGSRLWLGLAGLVLAAGVVAVLASRSGNSNSSTAGGVAAGKGTPTSAGAATAETRPVTITGTPLVQLKGDPDPAVGKLIPELAGQSFDGTPVTVTRDGRPKLVLFVAHWCPHCQREVPKLAAHLRANPLPSDVDMIAVATGTSPDRPNYPPSSWLQREQWPTPVLADSTDQKAATAYGLSAYPYFVAADASGKVVARTSGELSTDQFDQLVQLARGG